MNEKKVLFEKKLKVQFGTRKIGWLWCAVLYGL